MVSRQKYYLKLNQKMCSKTGLKLFSCYSFSHEIPHTCCTRECGIDAGTPGAAAASVAESVRERPMLGGSRTCGPALADRRIPRSACWKAAHRFWRPGKRATSTSLFCI